MRIKSLSSVLGLSAFAFAPSSGFATDYTFCGPNNAAYSDPGFSSRDPGKDWICQLPPDSLGARCPNAQRRACVGGDLPGPHDVPNGGTAWFWAQSTTSNTDVKCTCGCFISGTLLQTPNGEYPIGSLMEVAQRQPVQVLVRVNEEAFGLFKDSGLLTARDFTVGPEEKAIVVLRLDNGRTLSITENHPVIIIRDDLQKMVRAEEVKKSDHLLDDSGNPVGISEITTRALPKDANSVINLDTREKDPAAHILVAESVQVGDNKWQQVLQVRKSRLENRNSGDLAYLEDLK
jgi:hypothetical protein